MPYGRTDGTRRSLRLSPNARKSQSVASNAGLQAPTFLGYLGVFLSPQLVIFKQLYKKHYPHCSLYFNVIEGALIKFKIGKAERLRVNDYLQSRFKNLKNVRYWHIGVYCVVN